MKSTGRAAKKWCVNPDTDIDAALLTGPDSGVIAEAANQLMMAWSGGKPPEPDCITTLGENDLADRDRLISALLGPGLFAKQTPIVRLVIDSQRRATPIVRTLDDMASGRLLASAKWLIEAPEDLKPSSAMRRAFETSKLAICLTLPADTPTDTANLIRKQLDQNHIAIKADALDFLVSALNANRRMMRAEIEKLALYANSINRAIDLNDVDSITCTDQSGDARNAAFCALSGQLSDADTAAERFITAGGSAVSALRTLHFAAVFAFKRNKSLDSGQLMEIVNLIWECEKLTKTKTFPAYVAYLNALYHTANQKLPNSKKKGPPRSPWRPPQTAPVPMARATR